MSDHDKPTQRKKTWRQEVEETRLADGGPVIRWSEEIFDAPARARHSPKPEPEGK